MPPKERKKAKLIRPFSAEYAKSYRSTCKGCRKKIEQSTLRLANMIQDGKNDNLLGPSWYHLNCFFKKFTLNSVSDIEKFGNLKVEDQQKILDKFCGGNGYGASEAVKKGEKRPVRKSIDGKCDDLRLEYSVSSRAACCACQQKIMKGEIRCVKMDSTSKLAVKHGDIPRYYHLDCFSKVRSQAGFLEPGQSFAGLLDLKSEDQAVVVELFPDITPEAKEGQSGPSAVKRQKMEELDETLRSQGLEMIGLRSQLQSLAKPLLVQLLKHNKQEVPLAKDRILDLLSDVMMFGALEPCSQCKVGTLSFNAKHGYVCKGEKDQPCDFKTYNPTRKSFKIPPKLKKESEFLASYKFNKNKGDRLFQKTKVVAATKKIIPIMPIIDRPPPVLDRMTFVVQDLEIKKLDDVKKLVVKLGGKVIGKVDKNVMAVIATKKTLEKGTAKKIKDAKTFGIQVIPESFLDAVQAGGDLKEPVAIIITNMAISSWGTDVNTRLPSEITQDEKDLLQKEHMFLKTVERKKNKVQLRAGDRVDPMSNLQDKAEVYSDYSGELYCVILGKYVRKTRHTNYFKLQLLSSTLEFKFWVFQAWGRIGTTLCSTKLECFQDPVSALDKFRKIFEEHTMNDWRRKDKFCPMGGMFHIVDVGWGVGNSDSMLLDNLFNIPSQLEPPITSLLELLFDPSTVKKTLLEFSVPAHDISPRDIKLAYSELSKLLEVMQKNNNSNKRNEATILEQGSKKFYNLIPHIITENQHLPNLDNEVIVKKKLDMLACLSHIAVLRDLLKDDGQVDHMVHPMDALYKKLNVTLSVLNKTSEEFICLETFTNNSLYFPVGQIHKYDLEITEAFKVERINDEKSYAKFCNYTNKKLLWYDSFISDYPSILLQGMQIPPEEAPNRGYVFGRGIYLTDLVSRVAKNNNNDSTGVLLLCEVSLGNMLECISGNPHIELPEDKNSVFGVGDVGPDPKDIVQLPGEVEVPCGRVVNSKVPFTVLPYNEYVVYNEAQVKIQYLLQINYNYSV